ncbi:hypothetical protein PBY51_022759 [Eleginops maclovinus]|uniref:Histamine N-methyltransferase n=1 Tax=Eleginops maclovinus TaxID=56733 RepID=A0AAN7XII9_ELEMC|nr:hypothetical protein PBY51_022759 [Eleginops maclovinus]
MAKDGKQNCYEGNILQNYQVYLEQSGLHKGIIQGVHNVLLGEFQRIGAGKSSLDVLGVGSGGGEMDTHMLTLLQSTFPAVHITADIVEGSQKLTDNFKALVANLHKTSFAWHLMNSEDYERRVKAKGDMKTFHFIHMIQMIYYVDDMADTIKFYHSLLKNNGRLMIIVAATNCGSDTLWKAYKKELWVDSITDWRSSEEVISCLKNLGLKYEEHAIPNTFDISECFNPNSQIGERLLNFITAQDHFYQSFTPEIRAGMLDALRNKCSTEKKGGVFYNINLSCIFVDA